MDEQQNPNMQSGSNPNTPTEPNFANGIEYDAPAQPIISSAPEPQENVQQTNASKFFGGRSRASQIAASTPTTNYRQNAPEFFSQAMNQNDIVLADAQEQKEKSKKTIKMAGIIGGIALVAIIAVVAVISLTGSLKGNEGPSTEAEIKENLATKLDETRIYDLENVLLQAYNGNINPGEYVSEEAYIHLSGGKQILNDIETYFNNYGTKNLKESEIVIINSIKDEIKNRKANYEKIIDGSILLYKAVEENDSTSQKTLKEHSSADVKRIYESIYKAKNESDKLDEQYTAAKCYDSEATPTCQAIVTSMNEHDDVLSSEFLISEFLQAYAGNAKISVEETISDKISKFVEEVEKR